MWTERKKRIGPSELPEPIAARKRAAAPPSEKNRSAAPAGRRKWNVPLGQALAGQGMLNLGGILDGGTAGKEEHHVD